MIVRGPLPTSNFTVLANEVIRDDRLSYRARGILIDLLSRPADWRIDAEQIARHGGEGRRAVLTALTELEAAGYLRRTKARDRKTGRCVTFSVVVDDPAATEVRLPNVGYPNVGDATAGDPPSGSYTPIRSTVTNNGVDVLGAKHQAEELLARLGSGDGSTRSVDRAHEKSPTTTRPKRKRKPLTPEQRHDSWLRFRAMDLGDLDEDEEIRGAAFVELEQQHGAFEPDKWAARMIEDGTWDSFCAGFDLGHNVSVSWDGDRGKGAA